MSSSITTYLKTLSAKRDAAALRALWNALLVDLTAVNTNLSTHCLSSAGLVIKAGGSALVKAATAFYAVVGGVIVTKGANTDMAALSGTVLTTLFNVFVFYVDAAGTLTSSMGTAGATLAAVVPPATPLTKAAIGMLIVNPTGTGSFVGGTTAIDDATVAPGALYVNFTSAFRPTSTTLNTLTLIA